jgi:hypothetical protein
MIFLFKLPLINSEPVTHIYVNINVKLGDGVKANGPSEMKQRLKNNNIYLTASLKEE